MNPWQQALLVVVTDAFATALFVGLGATLVVKIYETRHDGRERDRERDFQARAALRETYAQLLVTQRVAREEAYAFVRASREARRSAEREAVEAHTAFINDYHRLALDTDQEMWCDLRTLRSVLDAMLALGRANGPVEEADRLREYARHARQNLEASFRLRLGHERQLQPRKDVGGFDKAGRSGSSAVTPR